MLYGSLKKEYTVLWLFFYKSLPYAHKEVITCEHTFISVSSKEQNTIRQEVKAKEYNIPRECVYIEKVSGKNVTERPVLT